MGSHEMSVEEVKKHIRSYFMVFGALLVLTVITVGISYLHLSPVGAITLALVVASIKGSLVALVFMHLSNEKKIIYFILVVTAIIFFKCMLIPVFNHFVQVYPTAIGG